MYLQKKTNIDVDDDDEFNHDIDYEEGLLQILKYPKITNLIKDGVNLFYLSVPTILPVGLIQASI